MVKFTEEVELALDRLVRKKMDYNYASREQNELWVYEDFANWLVNKFEEETNAKAG